jgi:small subunit ribosomal protein S6
MRYYESLYIVNPNYEQDRLDEVMNTVSDKIGEYGFSIINHRAWSKKRLAYAIQKHKYGTFVLIHFETESVENLNNFERFMVLQKPVLRNQTVVLDARPEVHIEEEPAVPENAEADKKTEAPKAKVEKTEEIVMKPVVEKKEKSSEASEEEPAVDQPLDEEASAVVKKSAGKEDSTVESEEAVIEPGKTEEVQE